MTRKQKSACVQYGCNHGGPNYIIYISNDVAAKSVVDLQWVESSNAALSTWKADCP